MFLMLLAVKVREPVYRSAEQQTIKLLDNVAQTSVIQFRTERPHGGCDPVCCRLLGWKRGGGA